MRAVVLRDLGDSLAVFINGTSPKWQALATESRCELALWLPSQQRQWRLRGRLLPCPDGIVRHHWPQRPRISKIMDYVYEHHMAQSSGLRQPDLLSQYAGQMEQTLPQDPAPPGQALALALELQQAEVLQLHTPPKLHERWRFARTAEGWHRQALVP